MPAIDPTYQPRAYRCEECGQLLGYVLRGTDRIRRLWVLRMQRPRAMQEPLVDVILREATQVRHWHGGLFTVVSLDSGTIGCNGCGGRQVWRVSPEGLEDMLRASMGEEGVKKFRKLQKGAGHVAG